MQRIKSELRFECASQLVACLFRNQWITDGLNFDLPPSLPEGAGTLGPASRCDRRDVEFSIAATTHV
jgi:hypothetical protein